MHIPPAFREDDLPSLHRMMRDARLANLVCATAEGPVATPLPLYLVPDEGPYGTLYGHLARANPLWTLPAIGDALVIFMGPDSYVTPSWYAAKQEHGKVVPTWNYATVHAYGQPEYFDDPDRLRAIVSHLTDLHEQPRAEPWQLSDAPAAFIDAQLRGIVGLRLPIGRIAGKVKMSQNRSIEDRARVADGLAAGTAAEQAAAALVRGSIG